ncbi:MAG: hypothetical protein EZS28_015678 [Streblomastix strix]|uniref:Uncharacterized protein n=1 Tax=Streblomastix strix TaxID=222440 RepID=A0A5J4W1Q6_9EUKA|nr:MAG: hypothetical protein EZS28_015678 [Streblomastix strix]
MANDEYSSGGDSHKLAKELQSLPEVERVERFCLTVVISKWIITSSNLVYPIKRQRIQIYVNGLKWKFNKLLLVLVLIAFSYGFPSVFSRKNNEKRVTEFLKEKTKQYSLFTFFSSNQDPKTDSLYSNISFAGKHANLPSDGCTGSSQIPVIPGSCTCRSAYHPKGCLCQTSSDTNCYCNSLISSNPAMCYCMGSASDPSSCLCTGAINEPNTCRCDSDSLIPIEVGSCTCRIASHPKGCLCQTNTDTDCYCSPYITNPSNCHCSGNSNDPSTCLCTGAYGEPDTCRCDGDPLQPVIPGSCTCKTANHPLGCYCQVASDSDCYCSPYNANPDYCYCTGAINEPYRCLCTGAIGEPETCRCPGSNDQPVEVGSCFCGNETRNPKGCKCRNAVDNLDCYCSSTNPNPEYCYCTGAVGEPSTCLCTGAANEPKTCRCPGPPSIPVEFGSCTCGNDHNPKGCKCRSNSDTNCVCNPLITSNPSKCICSGGPNDPSGCVPPDPGDSIDIEVANCTGPTSTPVTPNSCTCHPSHHLLGCRCLNAIDKDCVCSGRGAEYNPGDCTCSGASDEPSTCKCSGTANQPDTCTCSGPSNTPVTTGSCTCSSANHPIGCRCENNLDGNCICNALISPNNPAECTCSGAAGEPGSCLCSGAAGEPDTCTCKGRTEDPVPQGSCTCSPQHHPSGCRCQNGSDNNCECNPKTALNPKDCKCSGAQNDPPTCFCTGADNEPDTCTCPGSSGVPVQRGSCTCSSKNHPLGSSDPITCSCQGPTNVPVTAGSCTCSPQHHPVGCICDTVIDQSCIPKCGQYEYPAKNACACPGGQDFTNECLAGVCTNFNVPPGCGCPKVAEGSYTKAQCLEDKNLVECTKETSETVDLNSCTCTKDKHPTGCKCPLDPTVLIHLSKQQCKCLVIGDPRDGCDEILPTECTVASSEQVSEYSCICTPSKHPEGCICSQNPNELIGISKEQCKCLKIGDLRVGCETTPDCAHPTISTSTSICPCLADEDPREECIPEQKPDCAHPTISTSTTICPCLANNDPRVGCEPKPNCARPTSTTLTSDCPCLARGDPREECDIDDPCTATGSLRISLSFIAAAVILPLLMLW